MTKGRKVNRPRDCVGRLCSPVFEGLPGQRNWKLLKCSPTLARASYLDISTVGFLLNNKLLLAGWNAHKTVTLQFFKNIKGKKRST